MEKMCASRRAGWGTIPLVGLPVVVARSGVAFLCWATISLVSQGGSLVWAGFLAVLAVLIPASATVGRRVGRVRGEPLCWSAGMALGATILAAVALVVTFFIALAVNPPF